MKNGLFTILGGILAVFFALPFAAEEAKAQTAEMSVFVRMSGDITVNFLAPVTVDASQNVRQVVSDLVAANAGGAPTAFQLLNSDGSVYGTAISINNDGLPDFGAGNGQGDGTETPLKSGDSINLFLSPFGSGGTINFRPYDIGGGALALATVVRTGAADPAANEFFLSSLGILTTTPSTDNIGFVALTDSDCDGDRTADADGLMCELICAEGMMEDPDNSDMCIDTDTSGGGETEMPEAETTAAATTDNDDTQTAAFIGGGMVVVGGLVWYLSGGNFALFATTPEFGYSITESGYSYNYGGRADFRKDRWHLYWTAGQTNTNGDFGDFRYSSGGKWQGDIFAAAFSESVQGETADYDLSLSADWTGGIWKVSPAFAIDSVYEKGEFQTTNSFRINGEMRYDDWRFSASGNKTQMELSAVYRF